MGHVTITVFRIMVKTCVFIYCLCYVNFLPKEIRENYTYIIFLNKKLLMHNVQNKIIKFTWFYICSLSFLSINADSIC